MRTRYIFSNGSKWMSEAPRRMASSISLLTKRTMGASSMSSRLMFSPISSSVLPSSRPSSSMPSSSLMMGIWLSTCSSSVVTVRCSLSSSQTMASTIMPVWNLISSSACRLVGSDTPTNRRLPRRNSGSTRNLSSSLSLTTRMMSGSTVTASRSSSGTPNSADAAVAMSRADTPPERTNCETKPPASSRAAANAASTAACSATPSATSRWGRPLKALRAGADVAMFRLSFMSSGALQNAAGQRYARTVLRQGVITGRIVT